MYIWPLVTVPLPAVYHSAVVITGCLCWFCSPLPVESGANPNRTHGPCKVLILSVCLSVALYPLSVPKRVYPYVSAMLGNGTLSYDHDRDGRPTEIGGCTAMVRNVNHDTFLLIRYVRSRLTVGRRR